MDTIFMDECGYTGPDLLSPDQPAFVLASLRLEETNARSLKATFFHDVAARELKHANLSRRPRHERSVLRFVEHLGTHPDLFKIAYAHKQFALVGKMVDLVIEPCAARDGVNINERGGNLALAHALFYLTPKLAGERFFGELLGVFQRMVGAPSAETVRAVVRVARSVDARNDWILDLFTRCLEQRGDEILGDIGDLGGECLDIGPSLALGLMASWRAEISGPISLVHDESKAFAKQKAFWDAVVDPALEPALVGYDRRTVRFPIAVERTVLEPSEVWGGLQLTDVLAGAFTRCLRHGLAPSTDDEYGQALFAVMKDWAPEHNIWPQPAFTPEELEATGGNAEDPVAYLTPLMRRVREQLDGR